MLSGTENQFSFTRLALREENLEHLLPAPVCCMGRFLRLACMLIALSLIASHCRCGTTGYQASGARGGYADERLGHNSFHASYARNLYTKPGAVVTFLLHRCAEIAAAKGCFRSFVEANRTKPGHSLADTTRSLLKGEEPAGLDKSFLGASDKHVASALIRIFQEKPTEYPDAFQAREVLDKLGPEVKGKKAVATPTAR